MREHGCTTLLPITFLSPRKVRTEDLEVETLPVTGNRLVLFNLNVPRDKGRGSVVETLPKLFKYSQEPLTPTTDVSQPPSFSTALE